jgi:hypothetical protein
MREVCMFRAGGGCCIENESEADWRMEVLNEGKGGSEILLNEGK